MAYSLASISKQNNTFPPRVVLYGVEGIGKSTFGSCAPSPVFIQTEDGLSAIDAPAFPLSTAWTDVMDAIRVLSEEEHEFQTLVIDSADWAENLIMEQVAADNGMPAYDTNAKGSPLAFGRGNRAIGEYWRQLLSCCDYLRRGKNMGIIIVAHSKVQRYDDPTTEAYDRYTLDLSKEGASILTEWSDVVLFCNYHVTVKGETVGINSKKKRGLSSGQRFIYSQETPSFKAKSRWAIPDKLPLDYDAFASAVKDAQSL